MTLHDDLTPPADERTIGLAKAPGAWLGAPAFWTPDHFVESAWAEHGAFAFWLISALRPRNFVELGTHCGFSYFCVCQAVARLGLGTACYAVDSWAGDSHAGFYSEEVFGHVSATNTAHYSGFSTLMRGQFADALAYFPEGSIDLLHIDGRHGYEDVLGDYESWLPKLSNRAVVLFHDTNVRERNFGVWKLWDQLRDRHPSFEFLHGHGLGVLAVGPDVPMGLRPLVFAAAEERTEIQATYARLGRGIALQWESEKALLENHVLSDEVYARGGSCPQSSDPSSRVFARSWRRR